VDVLLLPSRWEGLPLVLMESQAAGVPCLCSDVVTAEAIEIPNLVFRLPLSQPLEEWAEAALRIARGRVFRNEPQPLRGTRFDIQVGVGRLEEIYSGCVASGGAL
jgi:glycosyltransferase involved in cell wall biosynthesis